MAKLHIEVKTHGLSFPAAVVREIWHVMHVLHMDKLGNLIVRLKIDDDEPINQILIFDGDRFAYYWENDWDEGAEKVTILGFMFVDEIEMVEMGTEERMMTDYGKD